MTEMAKTLNQSRMPDENMDANTNMNANVNAKSMKDLHSQYTMLVDCQKQWEKERVSLHTSIYDLTQKFEKSNLTH